jgi:dTDP-4-dehydrorhamnose 3,5-epimerase
MMERATLIYNPIFKDGRGIFAPLPLKFKEGMLPILNKTWLQSNISYNEKKYTFRGMHYQNSPYEQAKLVKVIKGKIIDFYFDMRSLSVDYGRCGFEIVNESYEILIPRGYAHGFITLEDNTIVEYLVDNEYKVDSEGSILWSSIPSLVNELEKKIPNFELSDVITSDKDKKAQKMVDWLNRNVLKEEYENK